MIDAPRENFRKHESAIWSALAGHLEAGGSTWDGEKLVVRHAPFAITLDVHADVAGYASHVVTRLRAGYINRDGFRFAIVRHNWIQTVSKLLGAQDVVVGDETFDKEFLVKATDPEVVRRLFASAALRGSILSCETLQRFEVRDHEGWFGPEFPEGIDELYVEAEGRITDVESLRKLYGVAALLLTHLCELGSAYESDPGLRL